MEMFSQGNLEGIAKALGNINYGLTESEIGRLLQGCGIEDIASRSEPWWRLFKSFTMHLSKGNDQSAIIKFIEDAMDPSRYVDSPLRHKTMCQNLNKALLFAGLVVNDAGNVISARPAQSLRDAKKRALTPQKTQEFRGVHPDVLKHCRAELAENNYFHAMLEAAKSIVDKLRKLTGLDNDGGKLAELALGTESGPPRIKINAFETDSDKSEQRGFLYLVKGTFSMFRNPVAHEPRIQRIVGKADAKDLLSLASLIHRRLDKATITPRTETK